MKRIISVIVIIFSLFEVVFAGDYYVNATTGSNTTGNGSSGTPWKTITYALSQINGTGHTLNVAAGTYNSTLGESFPILMKDGVSFIGAGAGTCIIDAGGANSVIRSVGIVFPGTKIEGLTLKGGGTVSNGGGIFISAGSVIQVLKNIITLNNSDGIYIENSSPVIRNNQIINNSNTNGILTSGSSCTPRIINNIIAKNFWGIKCKTSSKPDIINNTFSGNFTGLKIESANPDSVMNNVFAFHDSWDIWEDNSSSDPVKVFYNLFYASDNGFYYDEGTTTYYSADNLNSVVPECKNNISGDPFFTDRSVDNYHERAGSAVIDAGDPAFDFSNEPPPNGARINTGAYGNTSEAAMSISPPDFPVDLYVDAETGSNTTGDGSLSKPWKTITYALDQVQASTHILHIASGLYNTALGETFPIFMKNGISFAGVGRDSCIIDAEELQSGIRCNNITNINTKIEGLTIRNGTYPGVGGIDVSAGSNLKILNNKIIMCGGNTAYNLTGGGINISNSSPEISGNILTGNEGSAIFISSGSPTIRSNVITGNSGNSYRGGGITVTGSSSHPLIVNNEIVKNTLEGVRCNGSSIPVIMNNTISDNSGNGIQMGGFAETGGFPEIVNNIISFNTQYGIYEYTVAGDPSKVWYNLFYSNSSGLYHDEASTDYFSVSTLNSTIAECKNNLSGDPLFVDKTNTNYHILSGSSAINAGDPTSPLDPDGSPADIGAYYFISTPDAPVALNATGITHLGFQANWNASERATGYYLDVATTSDFTAYLSGYNNKNVANVTTISLTGLNPNTQYYYRVRAYNGTGTSISSNLISAVTLQIPAPVAPVALNATFIVQTNFNANWQASATATGYYLDVAIENSFINFVSGYNNKSLSNITATSVTGLSPNTTYYYRVRAFNAGGTSASSNVVNLTTLQITAPTAPTALAATAITQTGFTANWNASATAAGYYLDVATDNTFASFVSGYNNKDLLNVISYNITGLSANSSYYYRVRAYNTGGTSSSSNTITLTTLLNPPDPPSAPLAISATKITKTSFTANWNSVPGATGYKLDVATDNSFASFVTGYNNKEITNSISDSVGGLALNTNYYYRVRAINSGGASVSSNTITVTTLSNPPASPVCTSATSVTQYTFTANWNSAATATGYRLDVSTESSFATYVSGYNNKDVGNVINSSVTGLSLNTTYYYRVRAYNSGGTSGNSDTMSITTLLNAQTLPSSPTAISATGITQTGFTARWNTSSTSTAYYIDVSGSSSFATFLTGYSNKYVGNVTSTTVSGLTQKNSYYYRVRASNAYGTSGNSNTINVTTLPNPPSAPAGLAISSCNDLVKLTWTANTESDFLRYRIYGGTTANPVTRIDSTTTGSLSATTKTISELTRGQTYYFRLTAVIYPGVESLFSTTVSVKVKKGVVPKIKSKFSGAVLVCHNLGDSISSWQWYRGETSVSGATKQYYVTGGVKESFSVMTTDRDGCKNSSNVITISGSKSVSVYPNPAGDYFTLKLFSEFTGRTMISLYNSSGIKVLDYQTEKPDDELECMIPTGSLPDGLYTAVIVVEGEEVEYSRIMVIN